jgi:hypothetical protein
MRQYFDRRPLVHADGNEGEADFRKLDAMQRWLLIAR